MIKSIVIGIVIIALVMSGCVSSKGWVRQNGTPVDQQTVEEQVKMCNDGWVNYMIYDIVITFGILSTIHYFQAKKCMQNKGYIRGESKQQ